MISITNGSWTASVGDTTIIGPAARPGRWAYIGVSYDGVGRANLNIDLDDTQCS